MKGILKEKEKGITLIALVLTKVVLLLGHYALDQL